MSEYLLDQSNENDHIYVMWANRNIGSYCYEDAGYHMNYYQDLKGFTYNNYNSVITHPVINVVSLEGIEEEHFLDAMSIILAHEMSHCLKIREKYYDNIHNSGFANSYTCLMDGWNSNINARANFYTDILNGYVNPFCQSCMSEMYDHAIDYISDEFRIVAYQPTAVN